MARKFFAGTPREILWNRFGKNEPEAAIMKEIARVREWECRRVNKSVLIHYALITDYIILLLK